MSGWVTIEELEERKRALGTSVRRVDGPDAGAGERLRPLGSSNARQGRPSGGRQVDDELQALMDRTARFERTGGPPPPPEPTLPSWALPAGLAGLVAVVVGAVAWAVRGR